ncbi:MAG TPA: hypothetical protein VE528_02915 [Thermoleophilaceae bacterium]|nr:hypothetical protein [Thermoleophilaceae bacterium]
MHRARSLLRRLERADTDRGASALRRQLTLVAGVVRSLRRQLDELGERTDYARVSVTLTDESWDGSGDGKALRSRMRSPVWAPTWDSLSARSECCFRALLSPRSLGSPCRPSGAGGARSALR